MKGKIYVCNHCGDRCVLITEDFYSIPSYCPFNRDGERNWEEVKKKDESNNKI